MAISFGEPRIAPLEERDTAWKFGSLPPAMEMLEEEFSIDGVPVRGGKLQRSHSWSGYSAFRECRALAASTGFGEKHGHDDVEPEKNSRVIGKGRTSCSPREAVSPSTTKSTGQVSWATMLEEEEEELFSDVSPAASDATSDATTAASASAAGSSYAVTDFGFAVPPTLPQAVGVARPDAAEAPQPQVAEAITTYMVQNISRTLTRRGFLDMLDAHGFEELYDVVHLPKTFGTGRNKGFAFVNFINPDAAQAFAGRFQRADGGRVHDNAWRVAPADVQGFRANAAAASSRKMSRVRDNSCKPLIVATRDPA